MTKRLTQHHKRSLVLQALYQLQISHASADMGLRLFWQHLSPQISPDPWVEQRVRETWEHLNKIDVIIEKNSHNWQLSRIPALDLSILRLAVFELLFDPTVPPKVCIDEAIRLSQQYGSEDTPRFVNGVLDHIAKNER